MATNSILQDLYAQILQSEEQVKKRNTKFKAVNEEIAQTQKKTAEIRDELKSLQGSLAIQNNKVAEQELQSKWLKEKEKIMKLQKHNLEQTKLDLQNTLDNHRAVIHCERQRFIAECEEFSCMYDLTGDGKRKRDEAKKTKLEELMKDTDELKSEIASIKKAKTEVDVLENKKEKLLNEIKRLESKREENDKDIEAEKDRTERLRQEKQRLSAKLRNDPELKRLTAELKNCKEESLNLEGINDAMDQELNELRQKYYQKQLRKQREQRDKQRHFEQQNQQTRIESQIQTQQRSKPRTTPRPKDLSKANQSSVYFENETQGKGKQRPLFGRKK